MDAKNQEVLRKLRESMKPDADADQPETKDSPGMSGAIAAQLVTELREALGTKKNQRRRRAMTLVEYPLPSSDDSAPVKALKKQNRRYKSNKANSEPATDESKSVKQKPLEKKAKKSRKRNLTKAPPEPAPPAWIKKRCWRCRDPFEILSTWEKPPTMCKVCTKDIDSTYLPPVGKPKAEYKFQSIVSGGAPSLGKRR